jgi:hypothetical protein
MADKEPQESGAEAGSDLLALCSLLSGFVGPDTECVSHFLTRDGDKFERIDSRLNELVILLEEIAASELSIDPKELSDRLEDVFTSINAIGRFVADIKQRLQLLEAEVERRKPKSLLGFFKKPAAPLDFSRVAFDTDELLRQYGLAAPTQTPAGAQ